jgi:queuine tRNA-ribosyltransferase
MVNEIKNLMLVFMFEILKKSKKTKARRGILKTMHGEIKTPFFMPIATRGAVKGVCSRELEELGAEIILSNTYHLFLRPGEKLIKKFSGLHKFMYWPGPILTDSGGFQVFSLAKSRKIQERGAEFRSDIDGKKYLLTPEKSIEIQKALGSDIMMVLDECVSYPAPYEYVKKSVELTTRWAERCKLKAPALRVVTQRVKSPKLKATAQSLKLDKIKKEPLLFSIVQGGVYKDLRRKSAQDLIKLDFDGYAIGGLAVGEPREKMWEIVKFVNEILPKGKPRYLMGVGMPEDLVRAVNLGCDMFDCVIPTRNARHGEVFKLKTQNSKLFYDEIHILNNKYKTKFQSIDQTCDCFTCQNYTLAYLHHLFKVRDYLGQRLATIHNIKFYLKLMDYIREMI